MEKITLPESKLTKRQRLKFGPKVYTEGKEKYRIIAEVRHDDECGNGHNSFSITGQIDRLQNGVWRDHTGGCIHEDVAKHFPELAPFLKWHLTSTDGPMHYIANTLYLAGNRDHNGKLKGEPYSFDLALKFDGFPIEWKGRRTDTFLKWLESIGDRATQCKAVPIEHREKGKPGAYQFAPKYTLALNSEEQFGEAWHECPFESEREALQFIEALKLGWKIERVPTAWSDGKARELNAARNSAVWPEATDEQLCAEPEELKRMLLERLPALMAEFKKAVESLGLVY